MERNILDCDGDESVSINQLCLSCNLVLAYSFEIQDTIFVLAQVDFLLVFSDGFVFSRGYNDKKYIA